ncbi:MAG: polysaccharide export protein [Rhodobacteraceae bacterium]|nr:polysaccharide export protein [Paracoccaceae bacterium]
MKRRMPRTIRVLFCLTTALFLAGCSLPRGAAFQAEVLAASDTGADGEAIRDFAVEPVTRNMLQTYASWPITGEQGMNWIHRQPAPANRIIAAGDLIDITVWTSEDYSLITSAGQRFVPMHGLTVSSGGSIFLPYIGNVRIAGMSPGHARSVIEEKFVEITPSAQVQLELTEGRQSTVGLIGGVGRPGAYPMPNQDYTVLALLADGGGVQGGLNNPQIRLIRGESIYGISVARLFDDPHLNTTLRGGDQVFIEADDRFFLSLGAAGSEAVHSFPRQTLTALEAMAIIGGISDTRADPQGILILRQYNSASIRTDSTGPSQTRTVFALDLTTADGLFSAGQFRVNSGDLVYATESPVTSAQTIFRLLGSVVGLANRL